MGGWLNFKWINCAFDRTHQNANWSAVAVCWPAAVSDHFDAELIGSSRKVQHGRASHHSTHPLPINQSNGWALAWHMPQSEGLCEIYCSIQLHLQSRLKGCSHSSNDEWLEILINNFPGRRFAVSVGGGKKLRSMCHPRKHCCSSNPSQFQLKAHILPLSAARDFGLSFWS